MQRRRILGCVLAGVVFVAGACGGDDGGGDTEQAGSSEESLVGLFKLDPGQCTDAGVTSGSSFRMVSVGGEADGPFVQNGDSPCGDNTYSPMSPGSDGGLRTGAYQPEVSPPFDSEGNGATETIATGTPFFGVRFAVATNQKDPQTENDAPLPTIKVKDGQLSGDLSAFAAAWNNQPFNQGSPKPDGSMPGLTTGPTGTYDPATKKFTLDWSSQIVGGPFNNFTGVWHFEGTFEPS